MRLTRIELTNYRKYQREPVDFPDGLVGVIGPNGAGKSSLLEAVAWALYGNPAARTAKEEIKRQGSSLSDICQVVLEMEMDGSNYMVVREMRGKSFASDAAIYANKKPCARGAEAALDYATKLLGMDREAFFTSFFAKQKELNALSDLQPAERRTLVIKMLGIDDIDKAIDMVRSDGRDLSTGIKVYDETKPDINLLQTELEIKKKEAKEAKKRLAEKSKLVLTMEEQARKIKAEFEKEQKKKDRRDELAQEYQLSRQNLNHQEELLSATLEEKEKIIELTKRVKGPKSVAEIERSLKTVEGAIEEGEKALLLMRESVQKAQVNQTHLMKQAKDVNKERKLIEKLGPESKCPTCLRPLGEDFPTIEKHFAEEISSLQKRIKKEEQVIKDKRSQEEKLATEQQKLLARRDKLLELKPTLARLPELDSQLKKRKVTLEGFQKKLASIEQEGKKVGFFESRYKEVKEQYDQTVGQHHLLELEMKDIEKELSLSLQAQQNLVVQIEEAKAKEKEMAEARSRYQHLKKLEEIFISFRTNLIGRIRPTLSEKASDLLYTLTDGKYSQMELDENYEVFLYDNGERFPIDRFSGGEKDLANLCLRLAISVTLTEGSDSEFGFIVLDEIFGSQDTIRKGNIMRALANLSSRFRQIFLITHVEDIKDHMEHVINVSEDESGLAHLTLE